MIESLIDRNKSAYTLELLDAVLRTDFVAFIEKCFVTLNGSTEYQSNWHISAMAHHLLGYLRGETRLIINIEPRSLKSIVCSVAFVAWVLGHHPEKRIICVSYSADLARTHAAQCRAIMKSRWYRRLFPKTVISPEKDTEFEFHTTARGYRLAMSMSGALTGRGGDLIIIDDPMKPEEASSAAARRSALQTFDSTLYSRLDDKKKGAFVIVMQRLHVDDLVGHVTKAEKWNILSLPAIAQRAEDINITRDLYYSREAGDLLHEGRVPMTELDKLKNMMGSVNFSAQYLQNPLPANDGMIKWSWMKFYDQMPFRQPGNLLVHSWDTASKASEFCDYSVGTIWLVSEVKYYLLNVIRVRLEYPELRKLILERAQVEHPSAVLVEEKASGIALIPDLERLGLNVIGINPKEDKETRMHTQSVQIESGKVWLPMMAGWLEDFKLEVLQFPRGTFDDQIDSMSQFLWWMEDRKKHMIRFGKTRGA